MDKLCFAAIQMKAQLGDVDHNINAAGRLMKEAFRKGADWVILPEFFTSAMGFHPKMHAVALPLEGRAMEMLFFGYRISSQEKEAYSDSV
jgi:predicted amidohydrolase